MRFCRDCRHSRGSPERMTCDSPRNAVEATDTVKYLVTGVAQEKVNAMLGASCMALRGQEVHPLLGIQLCGYAGHWFEEK